MNISRKVCCGKVIVRPFIDDTYMDVFAVVCGNSFRQGYYNYIRGNDMPKHYLVNMYSRLVKELLGECDMIGNTIYLIQAVDDSKPLIIHHMSTYEAIKALARGDLFELIGKVLDSRGDSCRELTYLLEKDLITNI